MNKKFTKAVATGAAIAALAGLGTGTVAAKKHQEKVREPKSIEYTVGSGDTLYDISNKFYGNGMYFEDIADYNKIKNPDEIKAGDVIKVPIKENINVSSEGVVQQYTIAQDETLISICGKIYGEESYKLALALATYNNIENPDLIKPGQVINVPMYEVLSAIEVMKK